MYNEQQYLTKCKYAHFHRLVPIKPGYKSITLHGNYNVNSNFSDTQHDIILKLCISLSKYGIIVRVASFDGDRAQVK